ncbi:MAG: sucrase ferredoxin [Cyanobacteria bacterium J06643_4]
MFLEKPPDKPSTATTAACRYCSEVSQRNGEDPIGTAISAQQWLFIEVSQPWAKNPWQRQSKDLLALFDRVEKQSKLWTQLRILAIAADKEWSAPEKRHVFFYQQSDGPITSYRQMHHHVPASQLAQLIEAHLFQPKKLTAFEPFCLPDARALFVCTHTQYDLACGRFGTPLYRMLRSQYARFQLPDPNPPDSGQPESHLPASQQLQSHHTQRELSVWQTSHFGGHNFAPTLIDFPTGHFWGHLTPEKLDALIYRQGDLAKLLPCYRGWAALDRWGQIAERSLWMRFGWAWLTVSKSAHIIRQDRGRWRDWLIRLVLGKFPSIRAQLIVQKLLQRLSWAEVTVRWEETRWEATPEIASGQSHIRVEVSHEVLTQTKSGREQPLTKVRQYKTVELPQLEK